MFLQVDSFIQNFSWYITNSFKYLLWSKWCWYIRECLRWTNSIRCPFLLSFSSCW